MALKAKFCWLPSKGMGQPPTLSFRIECNNWLGGETFNLELRCAADHSLWLYKNLKLSRGQALNVDEDTWGWAWGLGDSVTIKDNTDRVIGEWEVKWENAQRCTSCGDTHRCHHCGGKGTVPSKVQPQYHPSLSLSTFGSPRSYQVPCRYCCGTGICMDCYLPPLCKKVNWKGLRPLYWGHENDWDSVHEQPRIPYVEPNLDFELRRMDEWRAREQRLKDSVVRSQLAGASHTTISGMEGLVTRAINVIFDRS